MADPLSASKSAKQILAHPAPAFPFARFLPRAVAEKSGSLLTAPVTESR